METIGLIAGNRKFPLIFCEAARQKGLRVVAVAIKKDTSPAIRKYADKVYWIGLSEFSRLISIFKAEKVTRVVMAGQISPHRLFSKEVTRDEELGKILAGIADKRADAIFGAIAERLTADGFELADSTSYLGEFLPAKGVLTKTVPGFSLWEDVYFGLELAKAIAYLDIGQAVAVKHKAVLAVEAMEGTDNLIRRAGRIGRAGAVVVKVSKPKQDMRFDVPVVGLKTVRTLIAAKAACLAIEAGKTLFIDKEASIRLADKNGIPIVAV